MTIDALYNIYLAHPEICTDTRKIKEGALYFALKGDNFNGNLFATQALALGAAYAIVDEKQDTHDERIILVDEVLTTLQALAKHHRLQLQIPVIAITGSNGKTTTKELLHAVLAQKFKTSATVGNLNNHIGVPLTLLAIAPDTEIAIVEMGANHQQEIAGYCTYALPNYGLINNCGKAHLEGFGSEEGVRKGKGELYDFIRAHQGTIFINNDFEYLQTMAQGIESRISYGTSNAQIIGKDTTDSPLLQVTILTHLLETQIQTQLTGSYNLPNVLAAVAVGHHFGVTIEEIKAAIEAYAPSNSRSQWMQLGSNQMILDAYNANPSSMEVAIRNLHQIEAQNKVLLLGSMKELGEHTAQEHQKVIDLVQQLQFTNAVFIGPEFEAANLYNYMHFANSSDLKDYLQSKQPYQNALILIKGSRGSKMEVALEAFA